VLNVARWFALFLVGVWGFCGVFGLDALRHMHQIQSSSDQATWIDGSHPDVAASAARVHLCLTSHGQRPQHQSQERKETPEP
jgi:hypothetical protein